MKRSIILIGFLLFCTGCATFSVNYDFDPEADFTRLKTYAWSPVSEKSPMNELTMKRIKIAVDKQLKAKGLTVTASENPDMLIALNAAREKRVDVQEWGYGHDDRDYSSDRWYPGRLPVTPGGRDYFEYRRGVDTYEYEVGTLVLDFVDAKKKELVWRGTASGVIDPGKTAEQIDGIIAKLLDNFPPPKRQ
ncbi:MAG: DUF4136 domain-containing protein [Thermodesulfovibrionales bacterium]|nr:DUF4136 domain-containing protein [Thermodesulfovibrionales bacterium]